MYILCVAMDITEASHTATCTCMMYMYDVHVHACIFVQHVPV